MDETSGTYVDDECFDLHDNDDDTGHDTDQSWWNAVSDSTGDPDGPANDDEENVELEPREGPPLVLAIGAEDGEHPNAQGGSAALRLQRRLTAMVDRRIGDALARAVSVEGREPDARRLRELSHVDCNHEWLWPRSSEIGPVLTPVEHVTAVRLRLGCAGPAEPALCGFCGTSLIDASASHALLCANSVSGHNAVRDHLHAAACACDPCA